MALVVALQVPPAASRVAAPQVARAQLEASVTTMQVCRVVPLVAARLARLLVVPDAPVPQVDLLEQRQAPVVVARLARVQAQVDRARVQLVQLQARVARAQAAAVRPAAALASGRDVMADDGSRVVAHASRRRAANGGRTVCVRSAAAAA